MARTENSTRRWLSTTTLGALISLAGLCLVLRGQALAENVCHADFLKTCPVDYAAKTCPNTPLSLEVPRPSNFVSIDELDNVGEYKRKLSNYKCSGAYDNDIRQVLDQAPGPGEKQLALVLDIDETALSNWPVIKTDDFGFIKEGPCDMAVEGACGFNAWQLHAKDEAIVPTLKLFTAAEAKKIMVFFITGRCEIPHMREATTANLNATGYTGWEDDQLIMRPKECPHLETVALFKAAERAKLEAHYRIIANVGDQWSDLNGGSAEKNFKVPNPFYFLPCRGANEEARRGRSRGGLS